MRTTIVMSDRLLVQAKRKARETGQTLSAYIEGAVQKDLVTPPTRKARRPFRLITVKGRGLRPGLSWSGLVDEVDRLDALEALGRKRPRR